MLIDIRIKMYIWNRKLKAATKDALNWGLDLRFESHTKARTPNVPHAVLLELIHRNKSWRDLLSEMEQYPLESRNLPRIVLRKKDVWSRPIPTHFGLRALDMDHDDMDAYVQRYGSEDILTHDPYHQMERRAREELFFILFLSRHGGIYMNPYCNHDDYDELLTKIQMLDESSSDSQEGWARIHNGSLHSLVLPPHHGFLTCIKDFSKDEVHRSNRDMSPFHAIVNALSQGNVDEKDGHKFVALPQECHTLNFTAATGNHRPISMNRHVNMPVKEITVSITTENEPTPQYIPKTTIDQLLSQHSRFCNGIWIWPCHRCLKSAMHGSYANCQSLCGSCFDFMYTEKKNNEVVLVNVDVHGFKVDGRSQMIPRVIHQTWFEDISPMLYPNLVRLQNSWKNSGWRYKFYTDESARQYIVDHFPVHFLEAYDSLIPGAYKADLFRYMLLMNEGGVYADVDVLLDASLEAFVTPSMTLFAPRDAIAEYADGQYCIWNGLLGAAPGHPVIVRAVERLVNLILNRADVLDLEREVAQKAGTRTETWKVRAVQELLLSGPCALGIAANEALGNDPVARFDVGWLNSTKAGKLTSNDLGDIMILMVSQFSLPFYYCVIQDTHKVR